MIHVPHGYMEPAIELVHLIFGEQGVTSAISYTPEQVSPSVSHSLVPMTSMTSQRLSW